MCTNFCRKRTHVYLHVWLRIFISADTDKKKSKHVSLVVLPVVFAKMQLIPDRICGDILVISYFHLSLQVNILGYPLSIFFIVINEFCERFSYYGMRGESVRFSGLSLHPVVLVNTLKYNFKVLVSSKVRLKNVWGSLCRTCAEFYWKF